MIPNESANNQDILRPPLFEKGEDESNLVVKKDAVHFGIKTSFKTPVESHVLKSSAESEKIGFVGTKK